MKDQADNVKAEMNNLSGNYILKERESGFRLHVFRGTKKGEADRYGWGAQDLFEEREGVPVRFETEDDAKKWIREHTVFCGDAYLELDKPMHEMVRAKRGRPATGKAMTAAERKRAQRERDRKQICDRFHIMGNWENITMTALLEGMASAVRAGSALLVEKIAGELARRATENRKEDHIEESKISAPYKE